ncbi:MAG TPA: 1-(5-phosphoribosyl)-5-[(5-phosphoribosylamino)methylideneamino]imidazole-4-carboxamide isomerase [Desulfomonilaceae bacterium]|nr:1-(5-phosphoribosyl)-5-[(5-phosphoribosylamino)methylideneamino]imidazole-4-carboxamide isomerase [Desulfomonilaceae bacterium]HVN79494.1 1-(5-phosphoribosyl)-5-[(5-phosphoribosylamino)methylideneamino]imidazole-4-carboxamide isomerase [Terriglobia bacterium]
MIIIPAIDIKEGRCVRLRQGRMDSSTIFNEDPSAQARVWESMGASRIHVVDLDGSIGGKPSNLRRIREITESVGVPVQLGGGIRGAEVIRMYLDIGVSTVILGTIAARDPERVKNLISEFPGRLAIGIDARSGIVAVEGWTESVGVRATELAAKFKNFPPVSFIYTDIDRDGMMRGPNIQATEEFARSTSVPVILSGGVTTLKDIENALAIEDQGVMGIIIGRALYEGTIDLREAIELAGKGNAR